MDSLATDYNLDQIQDDCESNDRIDFIPNAEFHSESWTPDPLVAETIKGSDLNSLPTEMPAHLKRMCESDLLTKEQEVALFREMNYQKFHAHQLTQQNQINNAEAIANALHLATLIRDHIVKSNMRLVMSIVKKYVTPQHSFDEILSEGILTLMQTVEKYDYDRGFRFSTYAYRSITRKIYRVIATSQRDRSRFASDTEEITTEQEDYRFASDLKDRTWSKLRSIMPDLMKNLDNREQYIIKKRYALEEHHEVSTFQKMADELKVSKERVRQLEQRAVKKLQKMAGELNLDEFLLASFG